MWPVCFLGKSVSFCMATSNACCLSQLLTIFFFSFICASYKTMCLYPCACVWLQEILWLLKYQGNGHMPVSAESRPERVKSSFSCCSSNQDLPVLGALSADFSEGRGEQQSKLQADLSGHLAETEDPRIGGLSS